MVLLTGDTHGRFELIEHWAKQMDFGSDDCIIILGDAGFNFYGNHRGDASRKRRINQLGVPIFCIHGNHEIRPCTLSSYEETEWHGGKVWIEQEYPNLIFAKDGETYQMETRTVFVIGGAYSVDKYYRIARNPQDPKWWSDEQPDNGTKERIEAALSQKQWKADVVLTHTCPAKYIPTEAFLPGIPQDTVDRSTEDWLDTIENRLDYEKWYCGHWHINKEIDKLTFLYDNWRVLC